MRMIYHTIRELLLLLIVSYMFLNFAEKLLVDTVLCYLSGSKVRYFAVILKQEQT